MKSAPELEELRTEAHSNSLSRPGLAVLEIIFVAAMVLYAVWFAVHYRAVYDPDIWWHLRAGEWMLDHHAVPQTDWLSTTAQGKPWIAYSWGFDVIVATLYRGLGLFGPIILYPVTMVLLIAAALWTLLTELSSSFWTRAVLAAGALVAMARIFSPRPGLFSVLFFTLELWLIVRAERSGSPRPLYWLPLLFAIWANVHIQFVYGLFVAGLYAAEPWIEQVAASFRRRFTSNSDLRQRWLIFTACVLAALLNPYTYRLYAVIANLARQTGQYSYISELQSPSFRTYNSFAELFMILAAWFVLGSQAKRRWVMSILLMLATVFAFRTVRDVWFGMLVCVFVLAQASGGTRRSQRQRNAFTAALATVAILLGTSAVLKMHPLRNAELWQDTSEEFPVQAVEYVKQHNLQGALYNDWYWGGFLGWSLSNNPIYVDSRTNLFGDQVLQRSIAVWSGATDWATDSALADARLVIANPDNALTSLLRFDPRFRVAYEDSRAVVFVPVRR